MMTLIEYLKAITYNYDYIHYNGMHTFNETVHLPLKVNPPDSLYINGSAFIKYNQPHLRVNGNLSLSDDSITPQPGTYVSGYFYVERYHTRPIYHRLRINGYITEIGLFS